MYIVTLLCWNKKMGLSQLLSFDDNKTGTIGLPFYYIYKSYIVIK